MIHISKEKRGSVRPSRGTARASPIGLGEFHGGHRPLPPRPALQDGRCEPGEVRSGDSKDAYSLPGRGQKEGAWQIWETEGPTIFYKGLVSLSFRRAEVDHQVVRVPSSMDQGPRWLSGRLCTLLNLHLPLRAHFPLMASLVFASQSPAVITR